MKAPSEMLIKMCLKDIRNSATMLPKKSHGTKPASASSRAMPLTILTLSAETVQVTMYVTDPIDPDGL